MEARKPIRGFRDLDVYQLSYQASMKILKEVLPKLPKDERFDLRDQMKRACKRIPANIAEGYAKKHQKKAFKKYLDDAMGSANEMIVHLSYVSDLGYCDEALCKDLIETYDIIGKQLYRLGESWS